MGYYTTFHFKAALKDETPVEVLNVLAYMFRRIDESPEKLPDHKFFSCPRWDHIGGIWVTVK